MTDQVRYAAFDELSAARSHDLTWGRQTILGSAISTIWQSPSSGFTQAPYSYYPNALGNYTWLSPEGVTQKGQFVRVWVREAGGAAAHWTLAGEVLTPAPPPTS